MKGPELKVSDRLDATVSAVGTELANVTVDWMVCVIEATVEPSDKLDEAVWED